MAQRKSRVVGGETRSQATSGAEKGQKDVRIDLVPWEALEALGRHYYFGSRKYEADNWRKGFPWSWSIAAMLRHIAEFLLGKDEITETIIDRETGEELTFKFHPLIAVAWHCFTLYWYGIYRKELDDRYKEGS